MILASSSPENNDQDIDCEYVQLPMQNISDAAVAVPVVIRAEARRQTITSKLEEFEPYALGKEKNPISFWGAVAHILLVSASPTLMTIPYTFGHVGYLMGFSGTILVLLVYAHCMHTVVAVEYALCRKLHKRSLTYPQVIFYSFSSGPKRFQKLANLVTTCLYVDLLIIWVGGNSVNLLMAVDHLKPVYDYFYDADVGVRSVMTYLTVPLILLCWIPNLRWLAVCSVASNVINISCIVYVLYTSVVPFSTSLGQREAVGSLLKLPLFLGTILITVNGTGILLTVKNDMNKPNRFASLCGVINSAYTLTCVIFSSFGVLCYLRYGSEISKSVLLNTPDGHRRKVVLGLFACSIILMYPLTAYVSYDILWNNWLRRRVAETYSASTYKAAKYGFKTLNALLPMLMAFTVPNISLFVALAGTVGVSFDSIIFPCVCEMIVRSGDPVNGNKYFLNFSKNITLTTFGVMVCITGFLDSWSELLVYCIK